MKVPDQVVSTHTLKVPDQVVNTHTLKVPDQVVSTHTLKVPDQVVSTHHTLKVPDQVVSTHTLKVPDQVVSTQYSYLEGTRSGRQYSYLEGTRSGRQYSYLEGTRSGRQYSYLEGTRSGRQYSYLEGTRSGRQYSGTYVDMSLESFKTIGVYAISYALFDSEDEINDLIPFESLESVFTTGYVSMENFVCLVNGPFVINSDRDDISFYVKLDHMAVILPDWRRLVSLKKDFIPSQNMFAWAVVNVSNLFIFHQVSGPTLCL